MKVQNHTHKLQKYKYPTGNEIFFCVNNCNFKIEAALALGKTSICHLCGQEFIMTEISLRLKRPHCNACSKIKVKTADGKSRFIRKNADGNILGDLAENAVDSLADRMKNLTSVEEDI